MASSINIAGLTLNPIENPDLARFIVEQVFNRPELRTLHNVMTGVKMKEQIVLAGQLSKTGIKATASCNRKNSGATSVLTEKFWEPVGIEDTLIHCQAEVDSLFKAYYQKIQNYKERYEIQGSDLDVFLAVLFEEAAMKTIYRAVWLADTEVTTAGAGTAGLIAAGNVKFYDYFDGLWKQIFDGVTATDIARYEITENAETDPEDQLTLASGRANEILNAVWKLADPRLRAATNAKFYVSNSIWDNQREYLQSKGIVYDINLNQQGLKEIRWNALPIVNMETIWDVDLYADFVDNTVNNAYYLPNRIVLTTPENIPVGSLNESDFNSLEAFYDPITRNHYKGYGFSLDAKVLEEYMIVVGY